MLRSSLALITYSLFLKTIPTKTVRTILQTLGGHSPSLGGPKPSPDQTRSARFPAPAASCVALVSPWTPPPSLPAHVRPAFQGPAQLGSYP